MTNEEMLERRIALIEENVQTLADKVNAFAVSQAAAGVKLDSLLLTLGELKESVSRLNRRPVQFWDKFLMGIIGAVAAAIGAALVTNIN